LGADHLDTLRTVENLETVYQSQGRYKEAKQLYRWALKVNEKELGTDHPDTLQTVKIAPLLLLCVLEGNDITGICSSMFGFS
jgi:tetratricopeptide (TPR) repeat protein